VLRDLCVLLRASARTSDLLGLRNELSRTQFRALPDTESLTASFGVATTTAGMEFIDLLCAADNQLYEAKELERF
jgi:PleD family two-component response regulator